MGLTVVKKWVLNEKKFAEIDQVLKKEVGGIVGAARVLTHPTRVKVLLVAALRQDLCLGEYAALLEIEFPTMVYHAHVLENAGFIHLRKQGSYSLVSLTVYGRQHVPPRLACDPMVLSGN